MTKQLKILLVLIIFIVFTSGSLFAGVTPTIKWELSQGDTYTIAINMPQQMNSGNVVGFDDAKISPECGNTALRISAKTMKVNETFAGAWKSFKITFKVAKEVVKLVYGVKFAGDIADMFIRYLESDNPGDFAKKTGEFVTGKLSDKAVGFIGPKIGKTGTQLKEAAKAVTGSYVFTKSTSESAKYAFRKLLSSGDAPFAKGRFSYPGCGDVETNFYISTNEQGIELHAVAVGDCGYQEQYGGATLGLFQVHGRFQLNMERRTVGDYQAMTVFDIPDSGTWEVAARCNKEENDPIEPPKPQDEFVATDAFTDSDLFCSKIGYDLNSLEDSRRTVATFYDQQAKKDNDSYLYSIQKAKDYQAKAEQETNPARIQAYLNSAKKWRQSASVWKSSYDENKSKANEARSLADATRQVYLEKMKMCIKTECSAGKKFGGGGHDSDAPGWTDSIHEDLRSLITEMIDEGKVNPSCYFGTKLWLLKQKYLTEEEVEVNFLIPKLNDSWIGLYKADELITTASWQDSNIIQKQGLFKFSEEFKYYKQGTSKFKAPTKPGRYKFVLFEKPEDAKPLATTTFEVINVISDDVCGDRPTVAGDQVYDRVLKYERTVKWYTRHVRETFNGTSAYSEAWNLTRADRFFSLHDWAITYIRMQLSWIFDSEGPASKWVLKRKLLSLNSMIRRYESTAKKVLGFLTTLKELKDSGADDSEVSALQNQIEGYHYKRVFREFPITCVKS
ncbi:MAG: hypothetical protein ISR65_09120 [Bacteriovoracaceae bacterium]|nr:hypothetical protein [Bacteriovoracaceae bacterium]